MSPSAVIQTTVNTAVKTAAVPQTISISRMAYIDVLRMVLTILVIMVHAAVTYGSIGDWTYVDPVQDEVTSIVLSFFLIICQSFFMGLFFFYSGFFTPGSYERKGLSRFWKDRLLRLGIPLVIYTWFLSRIPNYLDDVIAGHRFNLSFLEYTRRTMWTEADEGPTWFLFAVIVFSLGYTIWRLAARWLRVKSSWTQGIPAPKTKTLLGLALLNGMAMFAVAQALPLPEGIDVADIFTMRLGFFPGYILLFVGGILAYRNGWLEAFPGKTLRFWTWLSAALVFALVALMFLGGAPDGHLDEFFSGMNWRCALMCLWFGLASISYSLTLTLWLRDIKKSQNYLAAYAGPKNYGAYLIHPLVLVPISIALSSSGFPPMLKFVIASALTIAVCYPLAGALRRIPGMKSVL